MANLYEKYVWEVPVRVTHWVNVICIALLSCTGLLIGNPKLFTLSTSDYLMGWIRFVHFVAAYTFTVSVVSRLYWSLIGNRYASWREFLPFSSAEGRRGMLDTLRYYTFISRKAPHVVGHNSLAGTAYFVVFLLYLTMIVTGFTLYSEHAPLGATHKLFGWLMVIFTNQGLRLTHHLTMWFLIAFAIHHVYSAWLMDVKEKGGVMSSIFSGYKAVRKEG
ncbi:Ni/Fe-hydrogenase, b-type cytochrome subunit [Geomonas limicola]|uniref:Ni/Fe-hydrogenase, b-type cytochrome subunit n=1 Tax=Geomonas limicola TaxID=2740186 RepID=A0A6V8N7C2_9BACT|nr:Ni/Fe-hydrogenase, b-type cytochrome subunit [Geomonas limicola]GFO68465.1 Ni/Fe-hydrogenase, b-type cytochrome subunit [Geomonas limicola]